MEILFQILIMSYIRILSEVLAVMTGDIPMTRHFKLLPYLE